MVVLKFAEYIGIKILRRCVYILDLVIRHTKFIFSAPHYIVICGLYDYYILPHYLMNGKKV